MKGPARDQAAIIEAAASALGVELDGVALDRMLRFSATLAIWNQRLRLTGERDPITIAERHIADSLAVAPYLPASGTVVDIGSGQGFPGIILGCLRTDLELALIESRRRRASFLQDAIRRIPLPRARALEMRAEDAVSVLGTHARLVVARAVRLDVFLALARPLVAADGVAVAMQGQRDLAAAKEIALRSGFRLRDEVRYSLLGGTPHALLILEREI